MILPLPAILLACRRSHSGVTHEIHCPWLVGFLDWCFSPDLRFTSFPLQRHARRGTLQGRHNFKRIRWNGLVRMKSMSWPAWLFCRWSFSAARLANSVTASIKPFSSVIGWPKDLVYLRWLIGTLSGLYVLVGLTTIAYDLIYLLLMVTSNHAISS